MSINTSFANSQLVLLENPNAEAGADRLYFPLLLAEGKGYMIKCLNQNDEEQVIRGLGYLLMPTTILNVASPEVISASPDKQPLLCPSSTRYPIKIYRFDSGQGEQFYLHFPLAFTSEGGADVIRYHDSLYTAGCLGLFEGLNLDRAQAINTDPRPIFENKIFNIPCIHGGPITSGPKTFADWCLRGNSLTSTQKITVEALLSLTPQGVASLGNREKCEEGQRFLQSLSIVNLGGQNISELAPLASLKNISQLLLSHNPISDLGPLSELPNLTYLDLSFCKLTSITPLANLSKLTDLNLSHNQLQETRMLSSLQALTNLNLGFNQISDPLLHPLSFLKSLTVLNLEENEITDPTRLQNLKELTLLDLSRNKIRVARLLEGFDIKTKIKLDGNPLDIKDFYSLCLLHHRDATPLGGGLRELILYSGSSDCSSAAIKLDSLTEINLSNKGVSDLTPLQFFRNLRILNLSKNNIESVSAFGKGATLDSLRKLNLDQNFIKSMGPLKYLPQLEELSIEDNPIAHDSFLSWCHFRQRPQLVPPMHVKSVEALLGIANTMNCAKADRTLSALKELHLEQKELTALGPIGELTNIEALYLSQNRVFDVSPLKRLTNLKILSLKENYELYNMSELYSLTSLEELDLSGNPLHHLQIPLDQELRPPFFPKLKTLNLNGTSIAHVEELDLYPELSTVGLKDMPLQHSSFISYCLVYKFAPEEYYIDTSIPTMKALDQLLLRGQSPYAMAAPASKGRCQEIQDWLQQQKQLNFANQGITDAGAFADLYTNNVLDLQNNQIDFYNLPQVLLQKAKERKERNLPPSLLLKGNPLCDTINYASSDLIATLTESCN
ncbi:MAG: leucine-rich repeat domain-containing protein [Oligoflexia bacterium]|nr:leucine-rich repeat domain-containing protein [Oligoflexia bacterium]